MAVRIDRWLWSVRVFRTRTKAATACTTGRVRVNDARAKPARKVAAGDVVTVEHRGHTLVYEVVQPIDRRVSAAQAAECMIDRSPPRPVEEPGYGTPPAERDPGAGRPTKRDRRQIDRLRRRR